MPKNSTPKSTETTQTSTETIPQEASFAERGSFEGAYGEGSAAKWQDEQDAQQTDAPAAARPSGMGGADTAYDPETGFAPDGSSEELAEEE